MLDINVCVLTSHPCFGRVCVTGGFQGTGIPVASVATGFPAGQTPLPQKLAEIRAAVEDGAREIDIVISRDMALRGDWQGVYDEVRLFKEACGPVRECGGWVGWGVVDAFCCCCWWCGALAVAVLGSDTSWGAPPS